MEKNMILSISEIQEIIPHRYPFLLVDRIVEFVDNVSCVGIKNVTVNEEFFQGHFPGRPVMPGVLVLEAMAQVCAVFAFHSTKGVERGRHIFLGGVDEVRWKKQIIPGDTLRIEIKYVKHRGVIWVLAGTVTVDGVLACSGTITAAVVD